MSKYIVWHDNGKPGQRGYTELETDDIMALMAEYEAAGIMVYEFCEI